MRTRRVVTIGSLYSGIGGLEVGILAALDEAGIPARVEWQVEIDPFCQRVLAKHFPRMMKATGGRLNPEWVAVLMGFPSTWLDTDGPPVAAKRSTRGSRRARSLGNAVVPQCGLVAGRVLVAVMRGGI